MIDQPHQRFRPKQRFAAILLSVLLLTIACTGCQVLRPDPIPAGPDFAKPYNIDEDLRAINDEPIEIGKPNVVLDSLGWVAGIPSKITLWNRRVDNHKISEQTIAAVADYAGDSGLDHVKIRVNQYAPQKDWARLRANKSVHWLPRYTLGLVSLGYETIVPGRLVGGDHFNPFTQTVHLYSDIPAIGYHELGHAKDFSRRKSPGLYAVAYTAVPIWAETIATQDALSYVADTGDREQIADAVDILYPAYGTYAGNLFGGFAGSDAVAPIHYGTLIASHINARSLSKKIRRGDEVGSITKIAAANEKSPRSVNQAGEGLHPESPMPKSTPPSKLVSDAMMTATAETPPEGIVTAGFDASIQSGMIDGQSGEVMQTSMETFRDFETRQFDIPRKSTSYRDHTASYHAPSGFSAAMRRSDLRFTYISGLTDPHQRVEFGDLWTTGLSIEVPLDRWTGRPVNASVSGFQGDQSKDNPFLATLQPVFPTNSNATYSEAIQVHYEQTHADARIGMVYDANDYDEWLGSDRSIASDQVEIGLRYLHFSDGLNEPSRTMGISGGTVYSSLSRYETNVTNNAFLPYLSFSRSLEGKRFGFRVTASAFAGINAVSRDFDKTYDDIFWNDALDVPGAPREEIFLTTGQQLRLAVSYRYGDSIRLTMGTLLDRTDALASSFAERRKADPNASIDAIEIQSTQVYVSAEANF